MRNASKIFLLYSLKTLIAGFIFFSLSIITPDLAYAKDLGKIGEVYPIAENDLMVIFQKRIADLESNSGLLKSQQQFQDTIQTQMDRPQPVGGLSPTINPRDILFDPTVNVSHDIRDANNNLLAAKGTLINPLELSNHSTPFTPLIFYNADSKDQAAWALKKDKELQGNDRLILVGGSVFEQMKIFNKSVYFDQGGMITTRFGITHVPVIITQKGNRLLIQEVLPE